MSSFSELRLACQSWLEDMQPEQQAADTNTDKPASTQSPAVVTGIKSK